MVVQREVIIPNKQGLHFRPIMQMVDTAGRFAARITVCSGDKQADGRSPMELMMLIATQGTKLTLIADGDDAQSAVDALAKLIEDGFGEMQE